MFVFFTITPFPRTILFLFLQVGSLTERERGIVDFAFAQLDGGNTACPRKVAKVS